MRRGESWPSAVWIPPAGEASAESAWSGGGTPTAPVVGASAYGTSDTIGALAIAGGTISPDSAASGAGGGGTADCPAGAVSPPADGAAGTESAAARREMTGEGTELVAGTGRSEEHTSELQSPM